MLVLTRTICSDPWDVFDVVAHFAYQARALSEMTDLVFMTDQMEGVGTTATCRRLIGDKIEHQHLETAEYEPDTFVRLILEADDNLWDLSICVDPNPGGSSLSVDIVSRPARAGAGEAKAITDAVRDGFERDLDQIVAYCKTHRPLNAAGH